MGRPAGIASLTLLLATACANVASPSDGREPIEHPRGPDEVVLRLSYEGGFVPVEASLTAVPAFTLYGDGTVVTGGVQIAIYPPPALPAIVTRSIGEEGVQAALEAALEAGLGDRDVDATATGQLLIADAATAVFTITVNGRTTTASVYALGELTERPEGMTDEEFGLRRSLGRLAERLGNLEAWLPAGAVGPEEPYLAGSASIFVGPYRPQADLPQRPEPWPLGDLAGFGEPSTFPQMRCGVVSGDEWRDVRRAAASANQLTPWTSQGRDYQVLVRPLLPDEAGC
jgi:hypothetical protein